MNTRLEIASRVLAGIVSRPNIAGETAEYADTAIKLADALIAAEERTRKPAMPQCGTVADYERDVAAAQAAYDANPSSRNASDLHAAKEALERRQS